MSALQCIIPSQFISCNSRAAKAWGVVRTLNHPENGGTGSGKVSIKIQELASILDRSIRTTYRYIKAALAQRFFYSCEISGDRLVIRYASLTRVAKHLGLDEIGPIAEFDLEEIPQAQARASEAAAFHLQRASVYQKKKEVKSQSNRVKHPDRMLVNCPISDRLPGYGVIRRGQRMIYLDADWLPVGVSEQRIAQYMGCSERTIQRRFSDRWRNEHGLEPLNKAQSARLIATGLKPQERKFFIECAPEEIRGRLISWGQGIYLCGTNLYSTETVLRPQGYRKDEHRQSIRDANCSKKIAQVGASAFIPISIINEPEPEPEPLPRFSGN